MKKKGGKQLWTCSSLIYQDGHDTHPDMTLVQASEAARLSGLTPHQLREWCGRRDVVIPDVPAAGRGRLALFSWQTILALRVLKELHDTFAVEVGAWGGAIASLKDELSGQAFPSLWGKAAIFDSCDLVRLKSEREAAPDAPSVLIVRLDPHLAALSSQSDTAYADRQLPLFAAVAVRR